MSENTVEINGHMYRYQYDPSTQETQYLGPVGDSPPMNEDDFLRALCDIEARRKSMAILGKVEDYLDEQDIFVPDNMRTGDPEEAALFGDTYYDLEDLITEILMEEEAPLEKILNNIANVLKDKGVVINREDLRDRLFPIV